MNPDQYEDELELDYECDFRNDCEERAS